MFNSIKLLETSDVRRDHLKQITKPFFVTSDINRMSLSELERILPFGYRPFGFYSSHRNPNYAAKELAENIIGKLEMASLWAIDTDIRAKNDPFTIFRFKPVPDELIKPYHEYTEQDRVVLKELGYLEEDLWEGGRYILEAISNVQLQPFHKEACERLARNAKPLRGARSAGQATAAAENPPPPPPKPRNPDQEYEIELCALLDANEECDLIGHVFIAIDDVDDAGHKTGKLYRGFYPDIDMDTRSVFWENDEKLDGRMYAPGKIDNDEKYYQIPKFANRKWTINLHQVKAALKFIQDRTDNPGQYSLWTRQCNNFALDVLKKADISVKKFIPPHGPIRPTYTFQVLSGKDILAAQWPPSECLARMGYETAEGVAEDVKQGVTEAYEDAKKAVTETYHKVRDRF